jgi:hypothetical protein
MEFDDGSIKDSQSWYNSDQEAELGPGEAAAALE